MDTKKVILAMAVLIIGLAGFPKPEDKVVFLDVGQGDAILLQHGTRQVLIDGGKGTAVLERLAEEMPYFDRQVEVLVVSHPDQDHLEGLVHVFDRYEIGLVLLPRAAHTSQLQEGWLAMLSQRGVPYRFAWAGQTLTVGDIAIEVLGPIDDSNARVAARKAVNNASILTRIDYCPRMRTTPRSLPSTMSWGSNGGEVGLWLKTNKHSQAKEECLSLLLTGDAEQIIELALVRSTPLELLDVDILKAGHHGSKTSTSAQLLTAASPQAVVISLGEGNRFGHPHPSVLQRLLPYPVLRTDQHGSVRFLHLGGRWRLALDK